MNRPFHQIELERRGNVFCVRPRNKQMAEEELQQFGEDIIRLIDEEGCRKLVLNLGPENLACLYSIFLAKLVSIQKRLRKVGGVLKLANVNADIYRIFEICKLQTLFDFCPTQELAITELEK